jgi:nucleoside 2-deoxyribosyltransferase
MKKLIYIAGPYTIGDVAINIRNAVEVANSLFERGYIPFVPHLSHLWHFITPKSHEEWMEIDRAILERCDGVFRLEGESVGADEEVAHAKTYDIPVYYSIEELP